MRTLGICALVFCFSACLSACDPADTGTDPDPETGDATGITIPEVQQGGFADGTEVLLDDVVVTTSLTADMEGFFIQEPGGGEWSGVYVYLGNASAGVDLDVGDLATISGTTKEYYDFTEINVTNAIDVDLHGIDQTVTADLLPEAGPSDWEAWEGCLVTLPNQTTQATIDQYGEIALSVGIDMNDMFYVAELDAYTTCESITGVISFTYDEYKINPRSADDLVNCAPGEGPPPVTIAEIRADASYVDKTVTLSGVIATSGATRDKKGFFVQDPGGGAGAGLYVYDYSASVTVVAGQVLEITGSVTEYEDLLELKLSSITDVVDLGSTATPTVTPITGTVTDWEPYEGVLVEVGPVNVTSNPDSYGEADLDIGITMDDCLFDYDAGSGDSFASIIGPVTSYQAEYKICPRDRKSVV